MLRFVESCMPSEKLTSWLVTMSSKSLPSNPTWLIGRQSAAVDLSPIVKYGVYQSFLHHQVLGQCRARAEREL